MGNRNSEITLTVAVKGSIFYGECMPEHKTGYSIWKVTMEYFKGRCRGEMRYLMKTKMVKCTGINKTDVERWKIYRRSRNPVYPEFFNEFYEKMTAIEFDRLLRMFGV